MNLQGARETASAFSFQQVLPNKHTFLIFGRAHGCCVPLRFSRAGGSEHRRHKAAATELLQSRERPFPAQQRGGKPGGGQTAATGADAREAPAALHGTLATTGTGRRGRRRQSGPRSEKTRRANAPVSRSRNFAFTVPVGRQRGRRTQSRDCPRGRRWAGAP